MDLKTIRDEVRRLSALVDGWSAAGEIPAVERDLALEKLRRLYETVRFADPAPAPSEAGVVADSRDGILSESIDLGEVLSLDGFPDFGGSDEAPVSDSTAEPIAAPTEEREEERVEEEAEEEAEKPSEIPAGEPFEMPGEEPLPISEPTLDPEPAPTTTPETGASHHGAPTLFGPEEEAAVRHRHKQRVIMSLYDPNPVVESIPTPAPTRRPEPKRTPEPQPASEETPRMPSELQQPRVVPSPVVSPTPDPMAVAPIPEPPIFEVVTPAASAPFEPSMPDASNSGISEMPAPAAAFETLPDPTPAYGIPTPETAPAAEDTPAATENGQSPLPAGAVLGEVINHDVQTLADTIAPPRDVASELRRSEPVTDLRRAIGLNDKFLLIRDLFGGDGEAYERAIDALNNFEDLDDCMIFIAEHYAWNPNSDGAQLLMELLERKFA